MNIISHLTPVSEALFFNGDAFGRSGNFGIGSNLKAYFGYKPKSGMFVEAFGLYNTGQNDFENNLGVRDFDYSTTALGLGLGKKWSPFAVKLTFEMSARLGRNINSHEFQNTFMFRSVVTIGFRF